MAQISRHPLIRHLTITPEMLTPLLARLGEEGTATSTDAAGPAAGAQATAPPPPEE